MLTRREFLKAAGVISITALAGPVLSSCKKDPDLINTQLLWILNAEFNGFYAADIKGYYEDEGLKVELKAGGVGIDTLGLVIVGQSEIGVHGSSTSFLNTVQQGG